jgi:glycosyl transferase family 25
MGYKNFVLILAILIIIFVYLNKSENFSDNNLDDLDNLDIYVINLLTRPEKKIYIKNQLYENKLKYIMFEAIDGTQLDIDILYRDGILYQNKDNTKRNLRKGEIGCALSHIIIWSKMLSSNKKYFLILEDDAILVENFKEKLTSILNDVENKDWDMLYLNENCNRHFKNLCNGVVNS